MSVRLNKFLADRGVASRRASDRLIEDGRVRINGRVVTDLGVQVEEQRDRISVDGKPVGGRERHVYYVLNKPVGVITTLSDPEGRRTVRDMLPRGARVYPVGRLDADTSGLLLLTNDGELAHRLMHPRYGVAKVYRVRLAREPRPEQLRRLTGGVRFDRDKVSGPARARRIDPGFDAIMIEMVVHEGRFRQVRKMCESVGLEVTGLHRVGYGPIRLGPLARGMFRELSEEEVAKLRAESARAGRPAPASGRPVRPGPAARPRPAARVEEPEPDEESIEETWVPGGGFLEPEEEAPRERPVRPAERPGGSARRRPAEWPARVGGRRGDDDFRPASREPSRADRGPRSERPARSEAQPRREGSTRRAGPSRREGPPRGQGRTRLEGPARGQVRARREGPARGQGRTRSEGPARGQGRTRREGPPRGQGRTRNEGPVRGQGGRTRRESPSRSGGSSRREVAPRPGRPSSRFAKGRAGGGQRRVGTRKPSRRGPR
jgi:23S rRNA pseudouridine2605 synthase